MLARYNCAMQGGVLSLNRLLSVCIIFRLMVRIKDIQLSCNMARTSGNILNHS